MAQFIYPDSDIVVSPWTTSPLWSKVDEVTHNDATDFIRVLGNNAVCQMGLTNISDPATSQGHILRLWATASGSAGAERLTATIFQGATFIAGIPRFTVTRVTWNSYSVTFSAASANAIFNYNNLSVKIKSDSLAASEAIKVTQVELEVPNASFSVVSDHITINEFLGLFNISHIPKQENLSFIKVFPISNYEDLGVIKTSQISNIENLGLLNFSKVFNQSNLTGVGNSVLFNQEDLQKINSSQVSNYEELFQIKVNPVFNYENLNIIKFFPTGIFENLSILKANPRLNLEYLSTAGPTAAQVVAAFLQTQKFREIPPPISILDTSNPLTKDMTDFVIFNAGGGTRLYNYARNSNHILKIGGSGNWESQGFNFDNSISASGCWASMPNESGITNKVTQIVKANAIIYGSFNRLFSRYGSYEITDINLTSRMVFNCNPGGASVFTTIEVYSNLSNNRFYTFAGSYNGSAISTYVDGRKTYSKSATGNITLENATYIGRYYGNTSYNWDGVIQYVALWKRALSDTEIYNFTENPYSVLVGYNLFPKAIVAGISVATIDSSHIFPYEYLSYLFQGVSKPNEYLSILRINKTENLENLNSVFFSSQQTSEYLQNIVFNSQINDEYLQKINFLSQTSLEFLQNINQLKQFTIEYLLKVGNSGVSILEFLQEMRSSKSLNWEFLSKLNFSKIINEENLAQNIISLRVVVEYLQNLLLSNGINFEYQGVALIESLAVIPLEFLQSLVELRKENFESLLKLSSSKILNYDELLEVRNSLNLVSEHLSKNLKSSLIPFEYLSYLQIEKGLPSEFLIKIQQNRSINSEVLIQLSNNYKINQENLIKNLKSSIVPFEYSAGALITVDMVLPYEWLGVIQSDKKATLEIIQSLKSINNLIYEFIIQSYTSKTKNLEYSSVIKTNTSFNFSFKGSIAEQRTFNWEKLSQNFKSYSFINEYLNGQGISFKFPLEWKATSGGILVNKAFFIPYISNITFLVPSIGTIQFTKPYINSITFNKAVK